MLRFGVIVLVQVHFVNSNKIKIRPALVLLQEQGNIVVSGIASNKKAQGIPLTKKEGAIKESVIKLNYIFTISKMMVLKSLFTLNSNKKKLFKEQFCNRLN